MQLLILLLHAMLLVMPAADAIFRPPLMCLQLLRCGHFLTETSTDSMALCASSLSIWSGSGCHLLATSGPPFNMILCFAVTLLIHVTHTLCALHASMEPATFTSALHPSTDPCLFLQANTCIACKQTFTLANFSAPLFLAFVTHNSLSDSCQQFSKQP